MHQILCIYFIICVHSDCGHFGLWPFRSVAVPVCGLSGLWPFRLCGRFGLWSFRFVAFPVCGRLIFLAVWVLAVSVCGR